MNRRTVAAAIGGALLVFAAIEAARFVTECIAIITTGAELPDPDA